RHRALAEDRDWLREHVAGAALGHDQLRVRVVDFELAPQPQNSDVDRAIVDLETVQARSLEQLVPRLHALRSGQERAEQIELAVRELDGVAARIRKPAPAQVQLPPG